MKLIVDLKLSAVSKAALINDLLSKLCCCLRPRLYSNVYKVLEGLVQASMKDKAYKVKVSNYI